jgi:hypothetical protein
MGMTRLGGAGVETEMDFLDGAGEAVRDFAAAVGVVVLLLVEGEEGTGCLFDTEVDGEGPRAGVLVPELPFFGVGLGVGGADDGCAVPRPRLTPAEIVGFISAAFAFFGLDFAPAAASAMAKESFEVVTVDGNASPGPGATTPSLCITLPRPVSGASST